MWQCCAISYNFFPLFNVLSLSSTAQGWLMRLRICRLCCMENLSVPHTLSALQHVKADVCVCVYKPSAEYERMCAHRSCVVYLKYRNQLNQKTCDGIQGDVSFVDGRSYST